MSNNQDDLIYEYIENNNEEVFKEIIEKFEYIIKRKIYLMVPPVFYNDFDDIVNQVRIRIWEALKNNFDLSYNIRPTNFIYIIIEKTIKGYLQSQNYEKRIINSESKSLDERIGKYEIPRYNTIHDKINIEKEIVNKIVNQDFIDELYKQLTDMEKDVFNIIKEHADNGQFQDGSYSDIIKQTGFTYKQIDNVLYRVKYKARRIIKLKNTII